MANKQNLSRKAKRNETLTNRMMIVFALLLVSVFILMMVRNWLGTSDAINFYEFYLKAVPFLPIIPLVLSIASGAWFFSSRKNRKDETFKTLSSSFIFSICLVFLVVSLLISNFVYKGYVPAIIFVVLVSLLYFIAVSFPGSYLFTTVFNALAAFALFALNLLSPPDLRTEYIIMSVLAIIVSVIYLAIIFGTTKTNGFLGTKKLIKNKADYFTISISVVMFIAFVILGTFGIGSYVIYDIIIAIETIIVALFYAIKMLK